MKTKMSLFKVCTALMALIMLICAMPAIAAADDAPAAQITLDGQTQTVKVGDTFSVKKSVILPEGYSVQGGKFEVTYDPEIVEPIADEDGCYASTDLLVFPTSGIHEDGCTVSAAVAASAYSKKNALYEGHDNFATFTFRVKAAGSCTMVTNFDLGVFKSDLPIEPDTVIVDNEPAEGKEEIVQQLEEEQYIVYETEPDNPTEAPTDESTQEPTEESTQEPTEESVTPVKPVEDIVRITYEGRVYTIKTGDTFTVKKSVILPDGYSVQGGKFEVIYDPNILEPLADEDGCYATTDLAMIPTSGIEVNGTNAVSAAFAASAYSSRNALYEGHDNFATFTFRAIAAGDCEITSNFDLGVFQKETPQDAELIIKDNEVSDGAEGIAQQIGDDSELIADKEYNSAIIHFRGETYEFNIGDSFIVKKSVVLPENYAVQGGKFAIEYDPDILNPVMNEDDYYTTTSLRLEPVEGIYSDNGVTGVSVVFAGTQYIKGNRLTETKDTFASFTFKVLANGECTLNEKFGLGLFCKDDPLTPIDIYSEGSDDPVEGAEELAGQIIDNSIIIAVVDEFVIEPLTDTTAKLIGYNGTDTKVRIPEAVKGKTVVEIDIGVFVKTPQVESVAISDTVKTISDGAFDGLGDDLKIFTTPNSAAQGFAIAKNITLIQTARDLESVLGDVNTDGSVDSGDATLTLQYYGKLIDDIYQGFNKPSADVNIDAEMNQSDATLMLQKFGKLIDWF